MSTRDARRAQSRPDTPARTDAQSVCDGCGSGTYLAPDGGHYCPKCDGHPRPLFMR
jgi:hypothetical protein